MSSVRKRSRMVLETPMEDVTVRLEPSLGSLLASYGGGGTPVSVEDRRASMAERDTLGDRAREAEDECRRLRAENDELRSSRAWLVSELEAKQEEPDREEEVVPGATADLKPLVASLEAELDSATATVERLRRSEAQLRARTEAAEKLALEKASSSRKESYPLVDAKKEDDAFSEERKRSEAATKAASEATQETLRLRRELLEEREKVCRLEKRKGLREENFKKSRAAAAEERVRALEACLETMVQGNAEAQSLQEEVESLRFERDEWLRHFPEKRDKKQCARRALERLRAAEEETLELRLKVAELTSALKVAKERAADCEVAARDAEASRDKVVRDSKAAYRRRDLLESMRKVDQREIVSLRRLLDNKSNDDEIKADLQACVLESRKIIDEARRGLDDAPQKTAPLKEELQDDHKKQDESYRVLHLVDNPLTIALREKQAQSLLETETETGVDANKLHARLKERFRQHLNWFREAVYILTGFKIDMTTQDHDEADGATTVRLRSMFAERPDDALLFQWSSEGVQLLDTPFASNLDERLFASLTYCNSVPAFLATVQLELFDKSTLMPTGTTTQNSSKVTAPSPGFTN